MTLQPEPRGFTGPAADPTWLALRQGEDTRARDAGASGLLQELIAHLHESAPGLQPTGAGAPLLVVDVGAGTGSNHRYLSARLPFRQEWVAVDQDPVLLATPGHARAQRISADVADLGAVLEARRPERTVLVTCSALLDVLNLDQLRALASAIVGSGGTSLLSLSVTGGVRWDPPHPQDRLLGAAFDAHQQRDGRLGPDAAGVVGSMLEEAGVEVLSAPTPWRLEAASPSARHRHLLGRWLDERVEAALEQAPERHVELADWGRRRQGQLADGSLRVEVDHVDLLTTRRGSG